jgi:hypothetical protein
VVSFRPWPLYPHRKSPWNPLERKLDGPQGWCEHNDEEKISRPLLGLESLIISPYYRIGRLKQLFKYWTSISYETQRNSPMIKNNEFQHYMVIKSNCRSIFNFKTIIYP